MHWFYQIKFHFGRERYRGAVTGVTKNRNPYFSAIYLT